MNLCVGIWKFKFRCGKKSNINLPCVDGRPSETGQRSVSFAPVQGSISGHVGGREREKDGQREKQSGFVASSNGKRYCHIHILKAIVVSMIPKA